MTPAGPGRRALLRAGSIGAIAGAIASVSSRPGAQHFSGTPVARVLAPRLTLTDDTGGRFDLARQRGHVVLVYFGYTTCPDVCPTTLAAIAEAMTRLDAGARRVRTVFVTLDPGRDTPAMLRAYLANFTTAGDVPPIGLTGSSQQIALAARDWGVNWQRADGGVFIDHTSVVTAVASDGTLRLRYGFSQIGDPGSIASDLKVLLRET